MNSTVRSSAGDGDINTISLYSNLVQCFLIIITGYGVLRWRIISVNETKGLKIVLLYFLLPAAIINSLLAINWSSVNWRFLACIFAAKVLLFVTVSCTTLVLSNDMAKAGIYGIFVTHSNDLAFGVPIVRAFYETSHPDYVNYLFLALPISLLIIDPIAFVLIEVPRHEYSTSNVELCLKIFKGVILNPVVIATLIGLNGNFVFGSNGAPYIVSHLVDGVSQAFVPIALFTLGSALVSSKDPSSAKTFLKVTPIMLMLCKSLLLPLFLWSITSLASLLQPTSQLDDFSFFAFLYGCLPTAPAVYANAIYYDIAVEQISTGIAWNTFLSGPWLFVTTQMIRARHLSSGVFTQLNISIHQDVGFLNMLLSGFVTITWLCSKKLRVYPMYLLVMVSSYSFLYGLSACATGWSSNKVFSFGFDLGKYGLYVSTVTLAFFIYLHRTCSLCMTIRYYMLSVLINIGLPFVLTVFAIMISEHEPTTQHEHHLVLDLVMLVFCFVLVVHLLIQQQKNLRLDMFDYESSINRIETDVEPGKIMDMEDIGSILVSPTQEKEPRLSSSSLDEITPNRSRTTSSNSLSNVQELDLRGGAEDDEDGDQTQKLLNSGQGEDNGDRRLCPFSHLRCDKRQRAQCTRLLQTHDRQTQDVHGSIETQNENDHGTLLLIVAISCVNMFVSSVNRVSSLMHGIHTGVLAELTILEILLSHSSGILLFCLLGVSIDQIKWNILKLWRRWKHGSEKLPLPRLEQLDEKTQKICQRFVHQQLQRCQSDIASNIRCGIVTHRASFSGGRLVNWLIEDGLVSDRASGVKLGRRLVLGQVLAHVRMEEHFHDSNSLLYRFVVVPAEASSTG